ncbi:MAG: hypothetical protein M3R63_26275 [Actinomycetota bacterium]|nr:hypothetical protein [Actinomycetota bacterium]
MDAGSLLLARRAAEIEDMSLSAWISRLVRQHAWSSQQSRLSPEQQAQADERTAALDEDELAMGRDGGEQRAAE